MQAITGVPIKPTAIPGPELLELREIRDPMGKVIELAPGVLGQPKPSKTLSPGRERQGVSGSDNGRQCTPYSVVRTHSMRAVIECAGIPPIDGTRQASTNVPTILRTLYLKLATGLRRRTCRHDTSATSILAHHDSGVFRHVVLLTSNLFVSTLFTQQANTPKHPLQVQKLWLKIRLLETPFRL